MKVGEKYIIEIEEVIRRNGAPQIARVKGFNALVFDKYGLEKLEPYDEEKVYRKGYEDGMKAMQEQDAEIKVGDEVIFDNRVHAVVFKIVDNICKALTVDGIVCDGNMRAYEKTGRHFDAIAEVLAELRGEE